MALSGWEERINSLGIQCLDSLNGGGSYDRVVAEKLFSHLFGCSHDDSAGYIEVVVLSINRRRGYFFSEFQLQDILQETAKTFTEKLMSGQIINNGQLCKYVAGIARNKYREAFADAVATAKRLSQVEIPDPGYYDPAFDEIVCSDLFDRILKNLDEASRKILQLTHVKCRTPAEIVSEMCLTDTSHFYVKLYRAREKAREVYANINIKN